MLDVLSEGLCLERSQCRDAAWHLASLISTDRQLHGHGSSEPQAPGLSVCDALMLISCPCEHYLVRRRIDGIASMRLVEVKIAVCRASAVWSPVVLMVRISRVYRVRSFHLHNQLGSHSGHPGYCEMTDRC